MFFDPQGHTSRGIAFDTVIGGLHRAIGDAGKLRHKGQPDHVLSTPSRRGGCAEDVGCALAFKDKIVGVGLDSSEAGNPPSKFKHVFSRARDAGFFLTAHAGEEGPPAMYGRRSMFSESGASITAIIRLTMKLWWRGWRASAWR